MAPIGHRSALGAVFSDQNGSTESPFSRWLDVPVTLASIRVLYHPSSSVIFDKFFSSGTTFTYPSKPSFLADIGIQESKDLWLPPVYLSTTCLRPLTDQLTAPLVTVSFLPQRRHHFSGPTDIQFPSIHALFNLTLTLLPPAGLAEFESCRFQIGEPLYSWISSSSVEVLPNLSCSVLRGDFVIWF